MKAPCESTITPATRRDIPSIAQLLAESLCEDPLQRWLFPEKRSRLAKSTRVFRRVLKTRIADGLVRVIRDDRGEPVSVAVWTPPRPPAPSHLAHYSESLFMRWTYGRRIHEVRQGFTALSARHPREPYWYLLALATAPSHRGKGHAAQLLDERIGQCRATKELIALETSQPKNVSYYQKLGFTVEDELQLNDQFPVWLLCYRNKE
jgi:GNAT superfamily N-acetyltransferase